LGVISSHGSVQSLPAGTYWHRQSRRATDGLPIV
jgi:hypothetical protein